MAGRAPWASSPLSNTRGIVKAQRKGTVLKKPCFYQSRGKGVPISSPFKHFEGFKALSKMVRILRNAVWEKYENYPQKEWDCISPVSGLSAALARAVFVFTVFFCEQFAQHRKRREKGLRQDEIPFPYETSLKYPRSEQEQSCQLPAGRLPAYVAAQRVAYAHTAGVSPRCSAAGPTNKHPGT